MLFCLSDGRGAVGKNQDSLWRNEGVTEAAQRLSLSPLLSGIPASRRSTAWD